MTRHANGGVRKQRGQWLGLWYQDGVLTAYPLMVTQGDGHIVNTAFGAGLAPAVLTVAYTTTKHAVVGLSRSGAIGRRRLPWGRRAA